MLYAVGCTQDKCNVVQCAVCTLYGIRYQLYSLKSTTYTHARAHWLVAIEQRPGAEDHVAAGEELESAGEVNDLRDIT